MHSREPIPDPSGALIRPPNKPPAIVTSALPDPPRVPRGPDVAMLPRMRSYRLVDGVFDVLDALGDVVRLLVVR